MLKILLDGDMFCFRACASCERDTDWGNDIWTLHVDLGEAKAKLVDTLDMVIENALTHMKYSGDYEVIFCFSDVNNFRKKILPTYKANRVGKRKPVGYRALVDWVSEEFTAVSKPWLEADDCLGILATMKKNKDNCIVISGDKDMKCINGYHFDFLRNEFCYVDEAEAMRHFYTQTLMGDSTDGYSGCPKVGKVSAGKILDADCSWGAVVKAYEKAGLSEAVALEQARVAKILLASDYDFKKKEVILWEPKE